MERSDQHMKAVQRWFLVQGDKTLRLAYPLNPNSIVFDLGGYHGDWAASIIGLYKCTCHVFEPVQGFVDIIKHRYGNDPRFVVHDFAVGRGDKEFPLSLSEDGTSAFVAAAETQMVSQKDILNFVRSAGIHHIALMKINIEGGEYDLLDYIIQSGMVTMIDDIQVQFHDFIEGAHTMRDALRAKLQETHELLYDFPFVWESWSMKRKVA